MNKVTYVKHDDLYTYSTVLEVDKENNKLFILYKAHSAETSREVRSMLNIIDLNRDEVIDGLILLGWTPPDGC